MQSSSNSPLPPHPCRHAVATALAINVLLLSAGWWAYRSGSPLFLQFVTEDGMVEWLQFLSFVALSGLLGFVAIDHYQRERSVTLAVLGLTGLSALVGLAALEEVSWFQRVLGFQTPEFFALHNRQNETNLHNLAMGDESLNKRVLVKLIFVAGVSHNLILPWLARSRPALRVRVEAIGLYLPSLGMGVAYVSLVALSQLMFDHPRKGELGEAFGAIHYLATGFHAYVIGVGYQRPAVLRDHEDRRRAAGLFALFMCFIVLVAGLLGAGFLGR